MEDDGASVGHHTEALAPSGMMSLTCGVVWGLSGQQDDASHL